uniref:Inositol-tetrakisphosphate 1-kinase n=1 Tax=Myxobolus squamalis TaxID=59785 RepID=A0A6B2FXJ9_MYXSQ
MPKKFKVGCLLTAKDSLHLGLPASFDDCIHDLYEFIPINEEESILNQGPFDCILHKVSDYIKMSQSGDKTATRIVEEFTQYKEIKSICLDNPDTPLLLADRAKMFRTMDQCKFVCDNITIDVPQWVMLSNYKDISRLKKSKFTYPLICKAVCAGEGPGAHSMQLVFNPGQLDSLSVFPCVAQEFKNHNGSMSKIYAFGPHYFTCTRPSVRNFPLNGELLESSETICFDSHEAAKLSSKTFLNNFQHGFELKNSNQGDIILNEKVVIQLLKKLEKQLSFSFLGVDIIVTDDGSTYNLVDVNYLPSYDGVSDRFSLLLSLLDDFKCGKSRNYWNLSSSGS